MTQTNIPPMLRDANGDELPQSFDETTRTWVVAADAALTETIDFRKTVLLKDANGKVIPQLWSVAERKWIPRTTTNAGGGEVEAGPPGPAGDDGEDGKSAYQIAVENGFVGSEQQWLESLKGQNGKSLTFNDLTTEQKESLRGARGQDGEDGKSAYQIAIANGFVGTEPEWLASLKGTPGTTGENGSSVVSIELVSDGAGGFSGGSATLSNGDTIPIAITTA